MQCDIREEQLIDYHYGELKDEKQIEHIHQCELCQSYLATLRSLDEDLMGLEFAPNPKFSPSDQVNLNNVFAKADEIQRKAALKETLVFGLLAFTLLIALISLVFKWNIEKLLYLQLILYALLPFAVIPLLKNRKVKEV